MNQIQAIEKPEVGRRLLNVQEIAQYIGSTRLNIYQMVSKNQIPFVKIGRSTRFDVLKIDDWIERNSHQESPR